MSDIRPTAPSTSPCVDADLDVQQNPAAPVDAEAAGAAAKHAGAAATAAGLAADLFPCDAMEDFAAAADGVAVATQFFGNLFGERQMVEGGGARVAAAAGETAVEIGAERAASAVLSQAVGGPAATAASVVSTVDGFVDVDNPIKFATSPLAEANPVGLAGDTASLAYDAGVAMLAGNDAALAGVADDATRGEYGQPVAGYAMAAATLTGADVSDAATSPAAEQGENGFFVALGNAIGDGVADVVFGEGDAPRTIPVHEAERRESHAGALFGR